MEATGKLEDKLVTFLTVGQIVEVLTDKLDMIIDETNKLGYYLVDGEKMDIYDMEDVALSTIVQIYFDKEVQF